MNNKYLRLAVIAIVLNGMLVACQKDQLVQSVVADGPKPTAAFTFTGDKNITFNNTSANGDSYYWQFGDGTFSTEKSPVHNYAVAGKYTVTLKTNSTAGYSSTLKQEVRASSVATADFTVSPSFETLYTFTNASTAIETVSWDFGDNTTSTELSPNHKFPAYGNYTVKLTVNGLKGDVVTKTQTLAVTDNNLLKGGNMEAASSAFWTVYRSQTPYTFGNTVGKPTNGFDGNLRFPSFTNAAGQSTLIYQAVQVVAGQKYLLNAQVKLPAGGKNSYLQFYISTDANTWVESSAANANYWLALNNYHEWGINSTSTTAVDGSMVAAVLQYGRYGLGVPTSGVYTATKTGTIYIGIEAGLYNGSTNGDFLIDNVSFAPVM